MTKQKINKTQWILSQSAALAAHEVVDLARKAGIGLTAAQVYTVRHTARKRAQAQSVVVVTEPVANVPQRAALRQTRKVAASATDLRGQFRQLAVRMGTEQAQSVLDELRAFTG